MLNKNLFKRLQAAFMGFSPVKKASVLGSIAVAVLVISLLAIYLPLFDGGETPDDIDAGAEDYDDIPMLYDMRDDAIIALSSVGKINIIPLSKTDGGVSINSLFEITAAEPLSEQEMIRRLSVRTGESFTVRENPDSGTRFILSFDKPLSGGRIYNIEYRREGYRPLSFAFQTEEGFRLLSVFPADEGHNWQRSVPLNTTIELTFSEELRDGINLSDYAAVTNTSTNAVAGRWEQSERSSLTHVFFPDLLEYDEVYQISVKSGLTSASGAVIESEHISSFSMVTRDQTRGYLDIFGDVFESFLPDDKVFVSVAVPPRMYDLTYTAEIYRVNSGDDFARLLLSSRATHNIRNLAFWWEQHSNLNRGRPALELPDDIQFEFIETLERRLFRTGAQWNERTYLMLERTFPEGYYAIVISTAGEDGTEFRTVKLIQITHFAVYVDSIGEDILVWVNDTRASDVNRAAVQGARISYGDAQVFTDSNGIALFRAGDTGGEHLLLTVQHDGLLPFYTLIQSHEAAEVPVSQRYFHYMYIDRNIYRPNDTIDIFGCIRPRPGFEPLGESDEIFVTLGDIYSIPVMLDEYGTFAVQMHIADFNTMGRGGQSISLTVNGEQIQWIWAQFIDYINLMYNIEITTDRQVYALGEDIRATVTVTLFDGTPAAGVELNINGSMWYPGQTVMQEITQATDLTGRIEVSLRTELAAVAPPPELPTAQVPSDDDVPPAVPAPAAVSAHWFPLSYSISVQTIGVEENRAQHIWHSVPVVHRDVMIETSSSRNTVEIMLNEIDVESFTRNIDGWTDAMRSHPHDTDVTVDIIKSYIVRTNIWYEYDAIERRNIQRYTTEWRSYSIASQTYRTVNGRLILTDLSSGIASPDMFGRVTYHLSISYNDRNGRPVTVSAWYPAGNASHGGEDFTSTIRQFTFNSEDNEFVESWGFYSSAPVSLRIGETVRLSPFEVTDFRSAPVKINAGKSIGVVTQDRFLEVLTSDDSAAVTFAMHERYLPNVMISGAFFDGRRIFAVQGEHIVFDYTERRLDISMEFDSAAGIYEPGDEVTVRVFVADENGRGKQSSVNISVVDEAAIQAAWYWGNRDFAREFYRMNHFAVNRSVYVSYTQHEFGNFNDGAMGNGGEDDRIRGNFQDNPAFLTVETDENGFAEIRFTLADALTTWRITTHAVTRDGYVGNARDFIKSQLPFYTSIIMTNEFIEGDDITIFTRFLGTEYNPLGTAAIQYSIDIKQGDEIIVTRSGGILGNAHFNLGKLPAGEYIIRVIARYGEYSDGMELPFSVVPSGVRLNLHASAELCENNPVLISDLYDIAAGPVRVSVSNANMQIVHDILHNATASLSGSTNRTDRTAAGIFARHYLTSLFYGEAIDEQRYINEFRNYLSANNIWIGQGIPEITYGHPDIQYSARFAAAYPEFFRGDTQFENLFAQLIELTDNHDLNDWRMRSIAYFGLAALGRPVLNDIYRALAVLDGQGDTDIMSLLNYAAALAVLGDDTGAWNLLNKADGIIEQTQAIATPEQEEIDVFRLFINTTVNPEAALEHVRSYGGSNRYVSDSLELIRFVKKFIPADTGAQSIVKYTLDGRETQRTLTNHEFASFVLSREMFSTFNLTNIRGRTAVNISYIGSAENLDETNRQIEITRAIVGDLQVGNVVEIVYEVRLPQNLRWFTIHDRLPSGMRYHGQASGSIGWARNTERQFVEIHFGLWDNLEDTAETVRVSYYAVVAGAGEYIFEPAYISGGLFDSGGLWGATERITVNTFS